MPLFGARQMSLAGGRGADAYEQAVFEGREVPNIYVGATAAGRRDRCGPTEPREC